MTTYHNGEEMNTFSGSLFEINNYETPAAEGYYKYSVHMLEYQNYDSLDLDAKDMLWSNEVFVSTPPCVINGGILLEYKLVDGFLEITEEFEYTLNNYCVNEDLVFEYQVCLGDVCTIEAMREISETDGHYFYNYNTKIVE